MLTFSGSQESDTFFNELKNINVLVSGELAVFKNKIIESRINLFYKPWLATIYIGEIVSSNKDLKADVTTLQASSSELQASYSALQDRNKALKQMLKKA